MSIRTQIPESELILNAWYIGRGRNANVGQWCGDGFLVIAKCGVYMGKQGKDKWETRDCIKHEPYFHELPSDSNNTPEMDNYGTFQPFLKINIGTVVENFGDGHHDNGYGYGKRIDFPAIKEW